jgi:hypothetical protein
VLAHEPLLSLHSVPLSAQPVPLSLTSRRVVSSYCAGGVIGYSETTYPHFGGMPVVGFDMGGTSTGLLSLTAVLRPVSLSFCAVVCWHADVSRYAGRLEHVFETTTAGVTIQAPQLDISTVAAGGGSKLAYRAGAPAGVPRAVLMLPSINDVHELFVPLRRQACSPWVLRAWGLILDPCAMARAARRSPSQTRTFFSVALFPRYSRTSLGRGYAMMSPVADCCR